MYLFINQHVLGIEGKILKEISPEYFPEPVGRTGAELKLQYFGHLMQRADSLEKTLIWERLRAGGEGNNRA